MLIIPWAGYGEASRFYSAHRHFGIKYFNKTFTEMSVVWWEAITAIKDCNTLLKENSKSLGIGK